MAIGNVSRRAPFAGAHCHSEGGPTDGRYSGAGENAAPVSAARARFPAHDWGYDRSAGRHGPQELGRDGARRSKTATIAPASKPITGLDGIIRWDFDPHSTGWDAKTAFWMMWFAARAFVSGSGSTAAEMRMLGFQHYSHIDDQNTGLQALIAGNDEAVVVAFRGTDEISDLRADLDAGMVAPKGNAGTEGGRVHRGFERALDSSWQTIADTIACYARGDHRVWLTGHSLGGALATLAAVRLAEMGADIAPVYTFGAPAVGDDAFCRRVEKALRNGLFRVAYDKDMVPRGPLDHETDQLMRDLSPRWCDPIVSMLRRLQGEGDYCQPGRLVRVDENGISKPLSLAASAADMRTYWGDFSTMVGQRGLAGLLHALKQQSEQHSHKTYLRVMAKHRQCAHL